MNLDDLEQYKWVKVVMDAINMRDSSMLDQFTGVKATADDAASAADTAVDIAGDTQEKTTGLEGRLQELERKLANEREVTAVGLLLPVVLELCQIAPATGFMMAKVPTDVAGKVGADYNETIEAIHRSAKRLVEVTRKGGTREGQFAIAKSCLPHVKGHITRMNTILDDFTAGLSC